MDEGEFIRPAEQTLQGLDPRIEARGIGADSEFKGTGVLEIEFSDGSKIIVDGQAAARPFQHSANSDRKKPLRSIHCPPRVKTTGF
jgi:frataxin-like iron-binding protein CyaY